jgi:hypothetical protein
MQFTSSKFVAGVVVAKEWTKRIGAAEFVFVQPDWNASRSPEVNGGSIRGFAVAPRKPGYFVNFSRLRGYSPRMIKTQA